MKIIANRVEGCLSGFPGKPHHPKHSAFPKQTFGKPNSEKGIVLHIMPHPLIVQAPSKTFTVANKHCGLVCNELSSPYLNHSTRNNLWNLNNFLEAIPLVSPVVKHYTTPVSALFILTTSNLMAMTLAYQSWYSLLAQWCNEASFKWYYTENIILYLYQIWVKLVLFFCHHFQVL